MSIAPDLHSWTLTEGAERQLEGCGIALSELYRLVRQPQMQERGIVPGERRLSGYGIVATVYRNEVRSVGIDGATALTAAELARERAVFGLGDVAGADALVAEDAAQHLPPLIYQRRRRPAKPKPPPLKKSHVLDRLHPSMRKEITRLVAGDFSRLVIESPTRVTILPPPN